MPAFKSTWFRTYDFETTFRPNLYRSKPFSIVNMVDVYDRLLENISKDIPNEDTIALLKELLEIYRNDGPDGITQSLKERLEKLEGD